MSVVPLRPDAPQTDNPFRYFYSLGWTRLLPLYPADARMAGAEALSEDTLNQRLGKAPALRQANGLWLGFRGWGLHRASLEDLELWHSWGANVGMALDHGWLVFDIDITEAHWADEAERIVTQHLGEAPCRIGLAPKRMLFYRMSEQFAPGAPIYTATGDNDKIELFGQGRQVALFGRHRKAGKKIEWPRKPVRFEDLPAVTPEQYAACCEALVSALPEGARTHSAGSTGDRSDVPQDSLKARNTDTLRAAVKAIRNTRREFGGYDEWVRLAAAIRGAVGDDGFYEGEEMFLDFSERTDIRSETESASRVYRSVSPPFAVGAKYVYDLATRHGWDDPAAHGAEYFDPVEEREPSPFDVQAEAEREEARVAVDFQPWGERDLAAIPYPEFVYSDFYARGYTSVTLAPPKVGKSMLGLAEALDMASGKGLLTGKPRPPLKVVYYNAEDDQHVIDSRVAALLVEYGIAQQEIADSLFPVSGVLRDDFFMVSGAEPVINEALFVGLEAFVKRVGADVLIFDPLQDLSRSPETNDVFRLLGQRLRRMASGCGVALGLIHHTRKINPGAVATIDDGRGGSALRGTARFNRLLIGMSEEEGAKAGVDNHRRFMRVADMESNLAPPSADVNRWFEKVSVVIPNGHAVGAVRRWDWPDACEGVGGLDQMKARAEVAKADPPLRYDTRSARWVGYTVGAALGLDAADKGGKERIKAVVQNWIKTGILRMSEVHDARSGRSIQIVTVGPTEPFADGVFG